MHRQNNDNQKHLHHPNAIQQEIDDLFIGLEIKGRQLNAIFASGFTSLIYLVAVNYLFSISSKNSYKKYIGKRSAEQIDQTVDTLISSTNYFEIINNNQHIREQIMAAEPTPIISEFMDNLGSVIRTYYKKRDFLSSTNLYITDSKTEVETLSNQDLFVKLQSDQQEVSIHFKNRIINEIKSEISKFITINIPNSNKQFIKDYLKPLSNNLLDYPLYLKSIIDGSASRSTHVKMNEIILSKYNQQFKQLRDYISSLRFYPELASLCTTLFVINPLIDYRYPQGMFMQHVPKPIKNISIINPFAANKLVNKLENQYAFLDNFLLTSKKLTSLALIALILFEVVSGQLSPLSIALTLSIASMVFSQWKNNDPFARKKKQFEKEIMNLRKTFTNLSNRFIFQFTINRNKYTGKIDCCLIFHRIRINDVEFSEKEIRRIFEIILKNRSFNVESHHQDRVKIKIRLDSANHLRLLNNLDRQTIYLMLIQERNIRELAIQLNELRRKFPISFKLHEGLPKNDELFFDKHYQVHFELNDDFMKKMSVLLPSNKIKEKLPESLICKIICLLRDHRQNSTFATNTFLFSGDEHIQSSLKQKQPKIDSNPITIKNNKTNSDAVSVKVIRWRSGFFDFNRNDNKIVPIINGHQRHYTLCIFDENNFHDKGMIQAFKRVISEQPKFARNSGATGLKVVKHAYIPNVDDQLVPATYKAKLLGNYGYLRAAAYEEIADTGEILHIFTDNNIYRGRKH